jgi:hypothetical protein
MFLYLQLALREVEPPRFRSQVEPGNELRVKRVNEIKSEVEPPRFRSQVEPGNELLNYQLPTTNYQ